MDTPATSTPTAAVPRPPRPPRRWLRATAWTAAGVAALAVTATGGAWWWAGTDGSLATALAWIARSQPLSAERVTGSLRGGGHIDQLVWQQDGLRVDVRDLTLAWQPWSLLHGTLEVNRLAAASVQVDDQRPPSTTPSVPPSALGLPLPVVLDGFSIGQFQWTGGATFPLRASAATMHSKAWTTSWNCSAHRSRGRYSGRATLSSRSPLQLDASLKGALDTLIPGNKTPVPLAFNATARGPLTELLVKAELQMSAQPSATSPPQKPAATAGGCHCPRHALGRTTIAASRCEFPRPGCRSVLARRAANIADRQRQRAADANCRNTLRFCLRLAAAAATGQRPARPVGPAQAAS
jgi:translocation and assembly module TamB